MGPFDLKGKVALVTGGNGGIGLGMARGLAAAGAGVAVVGRNAEKNRQAVADLAGLGGPVEAFEADVAKEEAVETLVSRVRQRLGRIDVLVNNAGINIRKAPQEYSLAEWKEVLDTNLTSAFLLCRACYPVMKAQGSGKIINIGSMMSIFGASFAGPYASSKGGIVQFTRATASAWARDNIQVNAVLPGWIDTDLTRRARAQVPALHDAILARTPAGRWGGPEDMGGIAVFLASPASDFVTGTAIPVDGGYSIQGV